MKKERRRIIIDFEVLSKGGFWMCCMKYYKTEKEHIIINNREEFLRVFNKNKDSVWVGYNIKGYDQWIMKAIIAGIDPCKISDKLIEQNISPYAVDRNLNRIPIYLFELNDSYRSLKELELFMGEDIRESTVPFDLDRYPTKEEIEELKKQRPAKIEQLKAARALGDLSENTEYSTAKRELRHLESRIRYLNKQLQYAEIVKPNDSQTVDLGTTVTLQFEDDDETVDYIIVGKQEADLKKQKVSFDSPLGQAVLHHKVGETVTVQAPQSTYGVKILAVKLSDSDNDQ